MEAFFDFCKHRATRLDLIGRFTVINEKEVRITLLGDPALVDMFEISCWLGPRNAMVDNIETVPQHLPNTEMRGFARD